MAVRACMMVVMVVVVMVVVVVVVVVVVEVEEVEVVVVVMAAVEMEVGLDEKGVCREGTDRRQCFQSPGSEAAGMRKKQRS